MTYRGLGRVREVWALGSLFVTQCHGCARRRWRRTLAICRGARSIHGKQRPNVELVISERGTGTYGAVPGLADWFTELSREKRTCPVKSRVFQVCLHM